MSQDRYVNGSHARHYVERAGDSHSAIVKLQEERDALRARVAELEAELEAIVSGVAS